MREGWGLTQHSERFLSPPHLWFTPGFRLRAIRHMKSIGTGYQQSSLKIIKTKCQPSERCKTDEYRYCGRRHVGSLNVSIGVRCVIPFVSSHSCPVLLNQPCALADRWKLLQGDLCSIIIPRRCCKVTYVSSCDDCP